MGVIVGFVVGYTFGTRAGEQGWQEFKEAWKVISTSEEVRDMVVGGLSMARDLVARGSTVLAGPDPRARLRSVA
jgi:hypothetical protein